MSAQDELKKITDEIIGLTKSPLYSFRMENKYFPVVGEGNLDSRIMFVGEAPGEKEAQTGIPFCGRSGKMLDTLLASINMDRTSVYITNLVKDRPQDNRDPLPEEIALYGPFLDRQIEIMRPRVIATLGRYSMKYVFEKHGLANEVAVISKIHGKEFKGKASYGDVTVVALYHPAVALYNGGKKAELLEDFKILKKYI